MSSSRGSRPEASFVRPEWVRLAAVQFEPTLFRKSENVVALLRLAEEAARRVEPPVRADSGPARADLGSPGADLGSPGADPDPARADLGPVGAGLVVLPEMATTGYVFRSREEIGPYVEPIPGPTTRVFGRLARQRGLAIVVGLPEVDPDTGAFYNSAALIGPDGEVAGVYRKTHSFFSDTFWAAEGNLGLPVFTGHWPGPLGLLICMDAGFFEVARVMALGGARVLACPTNWLRVAPNPEWRARAAENGVHVVVADRWGEERGTRFAGGSCVIGPRGEILSHRGRGDGVIAVEVDLGRLEAAAGRDALPVGASDVLPDARWDTAGASRGLAPSVRRRPDLYHDLLRHPYRWPERYSSDGLGSGPFWLGVAAQMPKACPALPGEGGRRALVLPPDGDPRDLERYLRLASEAKAYVAVSLGTARSGSESSAAGLGREEVILLGPDGLLGRYQSPHAAPSVAPPSAAPHAALSAASPSAVAVFPVFDLPFARVGLLHPLDLLLPEPVRILAQKGVDLILASGVWPAGLADQEFLWAERAETNDVWLAIATETKAAVYAADTRGEKAVISGEPAAATAGPEAGPAGGPFEALGSEAGAGLTSVFVEIGAGTFSRRKDRLRRLRPELYLKLVAPGRESAE